MAGPGRAGPKMATPQREHLHGERHMARKRMNAMMSRTHIAIGVAAGGAVAHFLHLSIPESVGLGLVAGAGAALPDIDTEQSTASRTLFKIVPLGALVYLVAGLVARLLGLSQTRPSLLQVGIIAAAVMLLPTATRLIFGHRGATHSLLVWSSLLAILYLYGMRESSALLGASVCLGSSVGGILPDALTPAGVPALWPITKKRFHLLPDGLRIRTGGIIERLIVRPLAYLAVALVALRICGLI